MDIMKLLALFLIYFATKTTVIAYPPINGLGELGDVTFAVNQLLENPGDPTSSFPGSSVTSSVSSQCWRTAIQILQVSVDESVRADSAAALCSSLTEMQLKRLALEIATCHMKDVDKQMYQNVALKELCSKAMMNSETVQMCLQHLSDLGFHTYTQFLPYIQILCTRKTQEFFLDHQQEVIRNIAQNYAHIVAQANELLALQAEQMNRLSEIPLLVKEQVSAELEESMHDAKIQSNNLLYNETKKMNVLVTNVVEAVQERDREHRDRMDDWTSYQSSMLLQQSREMERHRSLIEEHRFKVQDLSETVAQTAKNMRPLLDLQAMMQLASDGYSWVTFLLYFLVTFNIIWIATRPERCHEFRSYLFGLVCAEAIVEIAMTFAVSFNVLSDVDRLMYIKELRRGSLLVECFTYAFGIIVSLLNSMALNSNVGPDAFRASDGPDIHNCLSNHHRKGDVNDRLSTANVDIYHHYIEEKKLGKFATGSRPIPSGLTLSPRLLALDEGFGANGRSPQNLPGHHIDTSQAVTPFSGISMEVLKYPSRCEQPPSQCNVAKSLVEHGFLGTESLCRNQVIANFEATSTPNFQHHEDISFVAVKNDSLNTVPSKAAVKFIAMDIEKPSLKRSASCSLLPMETNTAKRMAVSQTSS